MLVENVFKNNFCTNPNESKKQIDSCTAKNTLCKKEKREYKYKIISVGVIKYILLGRFIRDVNWLVQPCVIGFCLIITFITMSNVLKHSQHRDCY